MVILLGLVHFFDYFFEVVYVVEGGVLVEAHFGCEAQAKPLAQFAANPAGRLFEADE
jgi:hypothetical protein